jgi:hypothetical protein
LKTLLPATRPSPAISARARMMIELRLNMGPFPVQRSAQYTGVAPIIGGSIAYDVPP